MRFVTIGKSEKLTTFVNTLLKSRNFIFLVLFFSVFFPSVFSLSKYYLDSRNPNKTLTVPVSSNKPEPEALGVSSESATLKMEEARVVDLAKIEAPADQSKTNSETDVNAKTGNTPPVETSGEVKNVTTKTGRLNFSNNKFGIHGYANNSDVELASRLVNSHGGDWGWMTVTMDIHENSTENWNGVFSKMSEKHLIPIIQLSNNGKIPTDEEIDNVTKFLGGLSWTTKLRVVTAFSEVNASEYWGGKIDPEGYAKTLNRIIEQLKSQSGEFFVLNGAFNASAQTGTPESINCIKTDLGVDTCYLSEIGFLKRMNQAVPGIFNKLDGWASHTYPHPAYRGKPSDTRVGAESAFEAGRNTIRSYQFELRLLRRDYNLVLPVFITETGWPHKDGATPRSQWYGKDLVAQYYKEAFLNIFLPDANVVAVTPFILKRDDYDNFAFVGADGLKFPQWSALEGIAKTAGSPPR